MRAPTGTPAYLSALGKTLRQQRERIGLSQEQFAFEVEIDRTYVSGIERGLKNVTVAMLLRLAKVLGTTPAGLLRAAERAAK